jgi:hypothetical protein
MFCRFGSFALECSAFIAIWTGLSFSINTVLSWLEKLHKKDHIPLHRG